MRLPRITRADDHDRGVVIGEQREPQYCRHCGGALFGDDIVFRYHVTTPEGYSCLHRAQDYAS